MYDCIKNEIMGHEFYHASDYDVTGYPTICMVCKNADSIETSWGMGMLQIYGLIIFIWESQLAAFVLRLCASALLKISHCSQYIVMPFQLSSVGI